MKPPVTKCSSLRVSLRKLVLGAIVGLLALGTAQAQVLYITRDNPINVVGSYNAATGAVINGSLITGLSGPYSIAVTDNAIYVGNISSSNIGMYNLDGTTVNSLFISGFKSIGLAVSGSNLYATAYVDGRIGLYSSVTGAAINASLVTGLSASKPFGITLDRSGNMYIANQATGTVSKYSADGTLLNASLISGLNGPFGIAVDDDGNVFVANFGGTTIGRYDSANNSYYNYFISGLVTPTAVTFHDGKLYVGQYTPGIVGTYDASTGAPLNYPNWIRGVEGVTGIAIPEPSAVALLAFGAAGFILQVRKRRSVA